MSKRPRQELLGLASPSRKRRSLEDRGYGTSETPEQRRMRLAKDRKRTEAYKRAGEKIATVLDVKLRRMP